MRFGPEHRTSTKLGPTGGDCGMQLATLVGPVVFLMQVTVSMPIGGSGPGTHEATGVSADTRPQAVTTKSGGPLLTGTQAATGTVGTQARLSQWVTM